MRRLKLIASLLAVSILAGCTYDESNPDLELYDYRARYPLGVETDVIAVSFLGGAGGTMTEQERTALGQIVHDYKTYGQVPLTVVMGGSGQTDQALAEDIRATAVADGLAKSEVIVGVDPALPPGAVQVSYVSHTAVLPECGYWYRESYAEYENANSINFGCASQHNLGLMLADPSDLIAPNEFDPRDGQRTAIVVDLYRAGEATGATHNELDSSIVDVGE